MSNKCSNYDAFLFTMNLQFAKKVKVVIYKKKLDVKIPHKYYIHKNRQNIQKIKPTKFYDWRLE